MTSFGLGFQLKDSEKKIETNIIRAIKPFLNRALERAARPIEISLREIVAQAIRESPVFISLTSRGKLYAELGVKGGREKMEFFIRTWAKSITVKVNPMKEFSALGILTGGLSVQGIRSTMADVINTEEAYYISENDFKVPWLKWLVLSGDSVVISSHHVKFDLNQYEFRYSRTGLALMKKGGTYQVPSEFSGTKGNNFVTRAITAAQDTISQLIIDEISNAIRQL